MFTIKLIKSGPRGNEVADSISCPRYRAGLNAQGETIVTTFKTQDGEGPSEHVISIRPEHFQACYVENISGKTIAHFRPEK